MTDLHERLADAAGDPATVDVTGIRRRGEALRRQRKVTRLAMPAIAAVVVLLAIGMAVTGDDDGSSVLTDRPPTSTSGPVTTSTVPDARVDRAATGGTPREGNSPTPTAVSPTVGRSMRYSDPRGDTKTDDPWAVTSGGKHDYEPSLDIVGGSFTIGADALEVVFDVADLTDEMPAGSDGGYYQSTFTIWDDGEQLASQVIVQRYNGVEEAQVVVFAELVQCTECTFQFDAAKDQVRAQVPFEVIDRLLHHQGFDGLSPGDRLAGPGAETKWTHTNSTTPHAQEQPGPYFFSGAIADRAAGPGKSITL